jgi:hypothetical protein
VSVLGIGPVKAELIQIAGLNGGGLPMSTRFAEAVEVVSSEWPKSNLIFCAPFKSAVIEGLETHLCMRRAAVLRLFGEPIHSYRSRS